MYCSDKCRRAFEREHFWPRARATARRRGHRSCLNGCEGRIEVNHIEPLIGAGYGPSCSHHQSNLELLCATCHREVTALQRAQRRTQLGDGLSASESTPENSVVTKRRKGDECDITSGAVNPRAHDTFDREWARLGLSAPARRALVNAGLLSLVDLTEVTERNVLTLHGFGPSSLPKLLAAMAEATISFAAE